jgi:16S rRNA (uracil1498-N3)-methyltransferase
MRLNRVYFPDTLTVGGSVTLPSDAARHLITVLKQPVGAKLVLFNGDGHSYYATISEVSKRNVLVAIDSVEFDDRESPLTLHLVQGISRGDKMDLTLQKAVELGVTEITPIITERCGVKLPSDRLEKKLDHWRKVIISACEQCGRNRIPQLNSPQKFNAWLSHMSDEVTTLILNPHNGKSLRELTPANHFQLVIGPEGGLSESEVEQLEAKSAVSIQLGPRILRTVSLSQFKIPIDVK